MKIKGIGTDIIENSRMKEEVGIKVLTKNELAFFQTIIEPVKKLEFLLGRWAAKEAIIKATNKLWFANEISIINDLNGKPIVYYKNLIQKNLFLSISHEDKFTIAFAVWQ